MLLSQGFKPRRAGSSIFRTSSSNYGKAITSKSDAEPIIHYTAFSKINNLFENAEDALFEETYKNDPSRAGAYHFFNTVDIEDFGRFLCNVSAIAYEKDSDGNLIYSLELTIENPKLIRGADAVEGESPTPALGASSRKLSSFRSFVEKEKFSIKKQAEKDGSFMKAPNGKQTKLTEDQWLTVRTKSFKS
ncbi:MAG: hypothetical protein RSF35_09295, partial [Akkermansia sp.]